MPRTTTTTRAARRPALLMGAIAAVLVLATAGCGPTLTAPNPNPVHTTTVSTNPDDRTPHVLDGQVYAIVDLGDRVIVGGEFTQVKAYNKSQVLTRRGVFAYTKATGAIDTAFVPSLDRGGVRDIVVSPDDTLILGGTFTKVNGVSAVGLVKVEPTKGVPQTSFKGRTDGWVLTMALRGERLFVGGTFTKVNSINRYRLAAVKVTTGDLDAGLNVPVDIPMRGTTNVWRLDATRDGKKLVVIGNFRRVGYQARDQVAIVDVGTTSSAVSSWSTTAYRAGVCADAYDYYVKDVDISPDDRFFAVVTTGGWRGLSTQCDAVARWEMGRTGSGQQPTWADWTGGDSLSAVSITGAALYAAGHQRWANNEQTPDGSSAGPGAVSRVGIAAYNPSTGAVLAWTIDRERGLQVGTLTATDTGLWIGSDSSRLGNEWHPRVGYIPL